MKISSVFSTLALAQLSNVLAFAPNSHTHTLTSGKISSLTAEKSLLRQPLALSVLPPVGGSEFYDLHQSLSHLFDSISTSTLLSDAAAAVVEEKDPSWWDNYLQLYKNSLEFVHSLIDQPLRNAGWDQTWGFSIFLFTACKYVIY